MPTVCLPRAGTGSPATAHFRFSGQKAPHGSISGEILVVRLRNGKGGLLEQQ